MKLVYFIAIALLLLGESDALGPRRPKHTTLATFNAAIVPFLPESMLEQRTSTLIKQIEESSVDIFCLQEVYMAGIQKEIYAKLKHVYPYALSALDLTSDISPSENSSSACTSKDILLLQQCSSTQCPGRTSSELLACVVRRCAQVFSTIDKFCLDCLILHSQERLTSCLQLPASQFETTYGLMVLSKRKLSSTKVSGFNAFSQFRGYLEASVEGVGDLICTHLTSLLSTEAYYGPPVVSPLLYKSYDAQQFEEINTLFQIAVSKNAPILLGDFNHGPASPGNITWMLPLHYGLMNARGFYSPFVLLDGRCTICSENSASFFHADIIIDHIYVPTSMKKRVIHSKRIFDEIDGISLSDHYGVEVTLGNKWQRYYKNLSFIELVVPLAEANRLCHV